LRRVSICLCDDKGRIREYGRAVDWRDAGQNVAGDPRSRRRKYGGTHPSNDRRGSSQEQEASEMNDAEIIKSIREGTHTLVPMPVGDRKWFVGCYGDANIAADTFVLILDLKDDDYEGEEMCGFMMGGLTAAAAQNVMTDGFDRTYDDKTPF
jgi:hypothetical protein